MRLTGSTSGEAGVLEWVRAIPKTFAKRGLSKEKVVLLGVHKDSESIWVP